MFIVSLFRITGKKGKDEYIVHVEYVGAEEPLTEDSVKLNHMPCADILYFQYYVMRTLNIYLTENGKGIYYVALVEIENIKAFNNEMRLLYNKYLSTK